MNFLDKRMCFIFSEARFEIKLFVISFRSSLCGSGIYFDLT